MGSFWVAQLVASSLCLTGGMTSHAAVVARGMGRPCVAGAGSITVDYAAAKLTVGSVTVTEGQILTIDGSTGEVMVGEVPTALWWNIVVNPLLTISCPTLFRLCLFSVGCAASDSPKRLPQVPPQLSGSFGTIMQWADEVRDMKVPSSASCSSKYCISFLPSAVHV